MFGIRIEGDGPKYGLYLFKYAILDKDRILAPNKRVWTEKDYKTYDSYKKSIGRHEKISGIELHLPRIDIRYRWNRFKNLKPLFSFQWT